MTASPDHPTLVSILLRLYPRAWRARYADEFVSLLADVAPTPAMVLDIVVAALDARWSGDYPAAAGDDRKVRRPMVDRLSALLTAAGGILFTGLIVVVALDPPAENSPVYPAWLWGFPIAMAAISAGIAGLSLGWLSRDATGRGLGLVVSAFGAGIALSLLELYFGSPGAVGGIAILFPGFAVVTGLVGLRIVLAHRDRPAGLVLLAAGAIASASWLIAALLPTVAWEVDLLNVAIATSAWGLVGLLRLRPTRVATAMA